MHSEETEKLKTRYRRQSGRCDKVSMYRNTCILYLRSDPTLFNKFMEDLDNVCIALGILQASVVETDDNAAYALQLKFVYRIKHIIVNYLIPLYR